MQSAPGMGVSAGRARRICQMTGVSKSSAAFYPRTPRGHPPPLRRWTRAQGVWWRRPDRGCETIKRTRVVAKCRGSGVPRGARALSPKSASDAGRLTPFVHFFTCW